MSQVCRRSSLDPSRFATICRPAAPIGNKWQWPRIRKRCMEVRRREQDSLDLRLRRPGRHPPAEDVQDAQGGGRVHGAGARCFRSPRACRPQFCSPSPTVTRRRRRCSGSSAASARTGAGDHHPVPVAACSAASCRCSASEADPADPAEGRGVHRRMLSTGDAPAGPEGAGGAGVLIGEAQRRGLVAQNVARGVRVSTGKRHKQGGDPVQGGGPRGLGRRQGGGGRCWWWRCSPACGLRDPRAALAGWRLRREADPGAPARGYQRADRHA